MGALGGIDSNTTPSHIHQPGSMGLKVKCDAFYFDLVLQSVTSVSVVVLG